MLVTREISSPLNSAIDEISFLAAHFLVPPAAKDVSYKNEYCKRDVSLLVGGGLDWLKRNEHYNRSPLFPAPVSHFGAFEIA